MGTHPLGSPHHRALRGGSQYIQAAMRSAHLLLPFHASALAGALCSADIRTALKRGLLSMCLDPTAKGLSSEPSVLTIYTTPPCLVHARTGGQAVPGLEPRLLGRSSLIARSGQNAASRGHLVVASSAVLTLIQLAKQVALPVFLCVREL